ncbi:MAG TPA: hypothetical protein HA266_06755, partial [Candidatus Poseidoniaceae archaeon]|nr:hypothetical protein [Candidatus Poseidoniaceae archaeon]
WTGWIAVGGGALLIGNLMVELRESPKTAIEKPALEESQPHQHSVESVVILDPEEE